MPVPPPKKLRKGPRFLRDAINSIREYTIRTHIIPQQGFNETPTGVVPPAPAPRPRLAMWTPSYVKEGGSLLFKFARGGVVMLPYHDTEDSVSQLPNYQAAPVVPVMGGDELSIMDYARDEEDEIPSLTLPSNETSVIYLKIPWTARDEFIGTYNTTGDEYEIEVNVVDNTVSGDTTTDGAHTHYTEGYTTDDGSHDHDIALTTTNDGGSPAHSHGIPARQTSNQPNHNHYYEDETTEEGDHDHLIDGDFIGTLTVPLKERNYAYKDGADKVEVKVESLSDWETRAQDTTEDEQTIALFTIEVDEDGNVTKEAQYIEGSPHFTRPPVVFVAPSNTSRTTPTTEPNDWEDDNKAENFTLPGQE